MRLVTLLVPEEVKIGAESSVEVCGEAFGHSPVFKECSPERMGGLADADQQPDEAGLAEVELLGLEQSLGKVGEPRMDLKDQVAGLRDRQSVLGGHSGDAGFFISTRVM